MKLIVLIFGFVCLAAVFGLWFATGSDMGWTKTQVTTMQTDPLTGIEYPTYQDKLVFGLDFLVAGSLGSLVLIIIGLVFPLLLKKHKTQPNPTSEL